MKKMNIKVGMLMNNCAGDLYKLRMKNEYKDEYEHE